MDDDRARLDSGHDEIVTERPAVGNEDHERMPAPNLLAQLIDRSRSHDRPPSSCFNGLHQDIVGDPARVLVHERGELFDVRVHVPPVTENHRGRRAATERVGLRQVGDRQRQRPQGRQGQQRRQGDGQRSQHWRYLRATMRRMRTSRPMMIAVVDRVIVDAPPTSC